MRCLASWTVTYVEGNLREPGTWNATWWLTRVQGRTNATVVRKGSPARKIWKPTDWDTLAKKGSNVPTVLQPSPTFVDCNSTLTSTQRRLSLVRRVVAGEALRDFKCQQSKLICSCLQEILRQVPTGDSHGKMSWVRGWSRNDPRRPHLPMQHLFCPVLGLPTSGRTLRKAWPAIQRRGGQGENFFLETFHPILSCMQVVISIEGMAEREEETFTEEISTFVISVDGDQNESSVTEPSIKYTLVEWLHLSNKQEQGNTWDKSLQNGMLGGKGGCPYWKADLPLNHFGIFLGIRYLISRACTTFDWTKKETVSSRNYSSFLYWAGCIVYCNSQYKYK